MTFKQQITPFLRSRPPRTWTNIKKHNLSHQKKTNFHCPPYTFRPASPGTSQPQSWVRSRSPPADSPRGASLGSRSGCPAEDSKKKRKNSQVAIGVKKMPTQPGTTGAMVYFSFYQSVFFRYPDSRSRRGYYTKPCRIGTSRKHVALDSLD